MFLQLREQNGLLRNTHGGRPRAGLSVTSARAAMEAGGQSHHYGVAPWRPTEVWSVAKPLVQSPASPLTGREASGKSEPH